MLFLFFLFIQLIYWVMYLRAAFYKPKPSGFFNRPPVSVIICARNERENLLENLQHFLAQQYPDFEIIVVNDNSKDDTEDVLKAFCKQYNKIKVVNVPDNERFYFSKKFALTLGIKAAQHEIVLLADADCRPISSEWIQNMVEPMLGEKEIVLGYGAYQKTKGWLNKCIRFDTVYTALNYFSFAHAGMPYMGVGRNLCYKKSVFFRFKGFASHQHIQSGDDDLFVNQAATKRNTAICMEKNGFTLSAPKTSWGEWFFQKKRHYSAGLHYRFAHKLLLFMYPFSYLFFLLTFTLLLYWKCLPYTLLSIFLLRFIFQMFTFRKIFSRLGDMDLVLLSPFLELFYLGMQPVLLSSNLFSKRNKWK